MPRTARDTKADGPRGSKSLLVFPDDSDRTAVVGRNRGDAVQIPERAAPSLGHGKPTMALRIEDYALIGDCRTAALVGRDGSIDWLCWPRFDSAACFAALIGTDENGRWLIAPEQTPLQVARRYLAGTLVLETEFETDTGRAAVIDFMPTTEGSHLV